MNEQNELDPEYLVSILVGFQKELLNFSKPTENKTLQYLQSFRNWAS